MSFHVSFTIKVSSNRKNMLLFFLTFITYLTWLRRDTNPANPFYLDSQCVFPLAAFLTQIVIFVNQQDDYDDGHKVRGHFRAKEEGKKIQTDGGRVWNNPHRCANPVLSDLDRRKNKLTKRGRRITKHLQGGHFHLLLEFYFNLMEKMWLFYFNSAEGSSCRLTGVL